jgi:2-hydroxychromene-2-carboxylate isomerase
MYEEYQKTGTNAEKEYSRQDKLHLMRDVFSVEFGGQQAFTSNESVFPAFYAQDLITFGLEHDIVEAVRLGEKVMSENGYALPLDLQRAVKDYILSNAERYQ